MKNTKAALLPLRLLSLNGKLTMLTIGLGVCLSTSAGLKYTPPEEGLENAAGQVPIQRPAAIEEEFLEAENIEALMGSAPEAFERQSLSNSAMRMVPDVSDFEELKLRWEKSFGGVRSDGFTEVISRRSDLATIAVGHNSSDSSGRSDAWVVAIGDDGQLLWETTIGGARNDRANGVYDLPDGSLIVVGATVNEFSGRLVGLVAKLDESGEVLWRRELSGSDDLTLNTVIAVAQDRLVVAGTSGKLAGYVAELDVDGKPVWQQMLKDKGPDIVHALAQLPNGEIAVAGERTELFSSDAWLVRLSASGEPVWSASFGGVDGDIFSDLLALTDGSLVAVGSTYTEAAMEQGWMVRVNTDGGIVWEKSFGGIGVDSLSGVTVLGDQSLVVVGRTDAGNEQAPNSWVLRVSDSGQLIKARALGEEYGDGLLAIAARSDGSFAAVGFTQPDFDSQIDGYVVLLGTPSSAKMRPVYAAADAPTLFVPGGGQLLTERATVEVLGNVIHSRPVRQLFVDGQQTEILPNGAFVKQLSVPLGQTEITVDAVDDRGVIGSTTIRVVRTEQGQLQSDGDLAELMAAVDFGRYHALIIGNNNYPAADIPALRSAVNDARTVAEVLESDYSFDVNLLENATRSQIIAALDEQSRSLGPQDNLLVYYAGHGYYDEDVDLGYWLPTDASLASKEAWIRNSAITDAIKGMKAKHVLLVADSCFSGTLLRNVDVKRTGRFYERMAGRSARLVMTSGGIEPVMDEGGDGHSVFARNLIRKLRSSDQIIDGTSLYQAIREPVVMTSEQVPQYSNIRFIDSDGGDFLFVKQSR